MSTKTNIMDAIKEENADSTLVNTENGALGYAFCRSSLVEFFYKVSSFRKATAEEKAIAFRKALAEDADLGYRLLFFSRDARQGLGERQLFKDIFKSLDEAHQIALVKLVPEYGRWDDAMGLILDKDVPENTRKAIVDMIHAQFDKDLADCKAGKPISLLAKWMPSVRKVAKDKVRLAKFFVKEFGLQERDYRKALSVLREHLKVVEKQMSAQQWHAIDYEALPSKAAKNYREAFKKHDSVRYQEYLDKLAKGDAKVNAGTLYPYEIVTAYREGLYGRIKPLDKLLEAQWKSLPLPKGILGNAIVVRDGSGSMTTNVSGSTTALDIATSLAVLMSEHLQGPFANRFITFSASPKFIDLGGCDNLAQKLATTFGQDECSNTDVEATMDLILRAAVKNNLKQEEIPAVVIVSDMEFDDAVKRDGWYNDPEVIAKKDKVLFETIREKWNAAGYDLPKMVFWNVCNRSGAIPMQENANGLLLVSGFSQNILDMLAGEGTMMDIIKQKLCTERYDPVTEALKGV